MTTKQIHEMLTELAQIEHPQPVTYQLPLPLSQEPPQRSNQQLIRSVLYLGLILRRSNSEKNQSRDYLVDGLEALTSVMDNVYLVNKFGLLKREVPLLKTLGTHANKVWFVTLVLILRRLASNVVRLVRLKAQVLAEVRKMKLSGEHNPLKKIIIEKYEDKLKEMSKEMLLESLELAGTLVDLAFVSVELMNWKINPTLEKMLGFMSTALSLYRMTR